MPHLKTATMAFLAMSILACKKEKKDQPGTDIAVTPNYPDYTALKPGNYWIYGEYYQDSATDTLHQLNTLDSAYVEKDTTIGGKVYHKYVMAQPTLGLTIQFLRDSMAYTVNAAGSVIFCSDRITDTLSRKWSFPDASHPDTIYITTQLGAFDSTLGTGAGIFTTTSMRTIWHMPPSLSQYGMQRETDRMYARNTGMVMEHLGFYIASPRITQRRLLRYHLN